jgi:hypothetical protein
MSKGLNQIRNDAFAPVQAHFLVDKQLRPEQMHPRLFFDRVHAMAFVTRLFFAVFSRASRSTTKVTSGIGIGYFTVLHIAARAKTCNTRFPFVRRCAADDAKCFDRSFWPKFPNGSRNDEGNNFHLEGSQRIQLLEVQVHKEPENFNNEYQENILINTNENLFDEIHEAPTKNIFISPIQHKNPSVILTESSSNVIHHHHHNHHHHHHHNNRVSEFHSSSSQSDEKFITTLSKTTMTMTILMNMMRKKTTKTKIKKYS